MKKLEKYYLMSIELYDRISEFNKQHCQDGLKPIQMTAFVRKGAAIEGEDVAEEIKAKILFRLV